MAMIRHQPYHKAGMVGPWREDYRGQHYIWFRIGDTDVWLLLNDADILINNLVDKLEEARKAGHWPDSVATVQPAYPEGG